MEKVYIAGKVKGLPMLETEIKFDNAAKQIDSNGDMPINPVWFLKNHNQTLKREGMLPLSDDNPEQRKEIMKVCLNLLVQCDAILLLHDWQESEGAVFEKQVADFFNIPIYNA